MRAERFSADEIQPAAVGVSQAGFLTGVFVATHGTAEFVGKPLAARIDTTISFSDLTSARWTTDKFVEVEEACGILGTVSVIKTVLERTLGNAGVVEPRAGVVEATVLFSDNQGTSLVANVGGGRPDTSLGSVSVTSIFVVVLRRALLLTGSSGVVPFAEIRNLGAGADSGVLSAVAGALELDGVPDAARVSITSKLSGVLDVAAKDTLRIGVEAVGLRTCVFSSAAGNSGVAATEGFTFSSGTTNTTTAGAVGEGHFTASGVRKIPFALEVGLAVILSNSGGANLGADLGGVVPDAGDGIDFAFKLALVGVLTLLDAFRSAEFAHGVFVTSESERDVVTSLAAFLGVFVPHALEVGITVGRVGVLVRAASEASTSSGNPFAVGVGFAGLFTSSIEFTALTAFVGGGVPSAAHVIGILVETFSLTLAEDTLALTGTADPDVRLFTRTVPFALVGVSTFFKTDTVEALLVAGATVPGAVGVSEAGVLDEEMTELAAGRFEELVVFADVGIIETFSNRLFRAGGAALEVVVVPHTFRVKLAESFSVPAIFTFSLASRVTTNLVTDFRITVENEIAFSITKTSNLELQELGVGEVDADPLRIFTTVSVGTTTDIDRTLRGSVPDVFSDEGTISLLASQNVRTVATEALIRHTNVGTEDGEGAVDLVSDGSVVRFGGGGEDDGLEEDGSIDGIFRVGVAVVVTLLNDGLVGSEGGTRESSFTRFDGGGVADGRILQALGHVETGRAALDTVIHFDVPNTAVVPQTRLLVVVLSFATANANISLIPFASSVGLASSFVGVDFFIFADC